MAQSSTDTQWMGQALSLAAQGQGYVEPNPMVGCVLVAENSVIGKGFHERFGGPHAEVAAIADAKQLGNQGLIAGCTAYVTLEPCCHHGKTPPCTAALLREQVARVVVAMLDPFIEVSGKGITALRGKGVVVDVGTGESQAKSLNAPYLKRVTHSLPWVIAKWAMSLDGKIATRSGHSQWISSEESRAMVHELRGRVDAIMVGSGTALVDDPLLTARASSFAQPNVTTCVARKALRVVVDSRLRLMESSQLVRTSREFGTLVWAGPTADATKAERLRELGVDVVVCGLEDRQHRLKVLLAYLANEKQATNVMVEGGAQLIGGLLDGQFIDQCEIFLAPRLIGGETAITAIGGLGFETVDTSVELEPFVFETCGADLHVSCRVKKA